MNSNTGEYHLAFWPGDSTPMASPEWVLATRTNSYATRSALGIWSGEFIISGGRPVRAELPHVMGYGAFDQVEFLFRRFGDIRSEGRTFFGDQLALAQLDVASGTWGSPVYLTDDDNYQHWQQSAAMAPTAT